MSHLGHVVRRVGRVVLARPAFKHGSIFLTACDNVVVHQRDDGTILVKRDRVRGCVIDWQAWLQPGFVELFHGVCYQNRVGIVPGAAADSISCIFFA